MLRWLKKDIIERRLSAPPKLIKHALSSRNDKKDQVGPDYVNALADFVERRASSFTAMPVQNKEVDIDEAIKRKNEIARVDSLEENKANIDMIEPSDNVMRAHASYVSIDEHTVNENDFDDATFTLDCILRQKDNFPFGSLTNLTYIKYANVRMRGEIFPGFNAYRKHDAFAWYRCKVATSKLTIKSIQQMHLDNRVFFTELKILSSINHANVMTLMGVAYDNDTKNIVVLLEDFRCPLFSYIHELSSAISLNDIISITRQLTDALKYLHALNIVHTCVSSHNVIVKRHQSIHVKLANFESALTIDQDDDDDDGKHQLRLRYYQWLAPEVLTRNGAIDASVDVYSLAVVMWECCLLKPPWKNIQLQQLTDVYSIWKLPLMTPKNIFPQFVHDILNVALAVKRVDRKIDIGKIQTHLERAHAKYRARDDIYYHSVLNATPHEMDSGVSETSVNDVGRKRYEQTIMFVVKNQRKKERKKDQKRVNFGRKKKRVEKTEKVPENGSEIIVDDNDDDDYKRIFKNVSDHFEKIDGLLAKVNVDSMESAREYDRDMINNFINITQRFERIFQRLQTIHDDDVNDRVEKSCDLSDGISTVRAMIKKHEEWIQKRNDSFVSQEPSPQKQKIPEIKHTMEKPVREHHSTYSNLPTSIRESIVINQKLIDQRNDRDQSHAVTQTDGPIDVIVRNFDKDFEKVKKLDVFERVLRECFANYRVESNEFIKRLSQSLQRIEMLQHELLSARNKSTKPKKCLKCEEFIAKIQKGLPNNKWAIKCGQINWQSGCIARLLHRSQMSLTDTLDSMSVHSYFDRSNQNTLSRSGDNKIKRCVSFNEIAQVVSTEDIYIDDGFSSDEPLACNMQLSTESSAVGKCLQFDAQLLQCLLNDHDFVFDELICPLVNSNTPRLD